MMPCLHQGSLDGWVAVWVWVWFWAGDCAYAPGRSMPSARAAHRICGAMREPYLCRAVTKASPAVRRCYWTDATQDVKGGRVRLRLSARASEGASVSKVMTDRPETPAAFGSSAMVWGWAGQLSATTTLGWPAAP